MASNNGDLWSEKVSKVFNAKPLIAEEGNTRWIERSEETKLRSAIASIGIHACLYGPSGSGKTSLAKTALARMGRRGKRHIYVRINNSTTWSSFKSQIIENKQAKVDTESTTGIKLGIKNLLPYIEFSGQLGEGGVRSAIERSKIVDSINLSTLAQILVDSGICLVVDDVNFANDLLLRELTDLAKEITDYPSENSAKIIFVGADDIFIRIIKTEPSLKDRMDEIALGSIEDPESADRQIKRDRVWKFIWDGLSMLGFNKSDTCISKEHQAICMKSVEHAADGLPKCIVRLGRNISEACAGKSFVTVSDITKCADQMTVRNFQNYRANYRTLIECLRKDKLLPDICVWMFNQGASRIHTVEHVAEDMRDIAPYYLIEESLKVLEALNFIVLTGSSLNVFFARDPLLAHTLGVALSHPEQCGIRENYFGIDQSVKQLFLRFPSKNDPESKLVIS
jgi:hypothetical protein